MPKRESNPLKVLHPKCRKVHKIKRLEERYDKLATTVNVRHRHKSQTDVLMYKIFKLKTQELVGETARALTEEEAHSIIETYINRNNRLIDDNQSAPKNSKWDGMEYEQGRRKEEQQYASGVFKAPDMLSKKAVRALITWDEMGKSAPGLPTRLYKRK